MEHHQFIYNGETLDPQCTFLSYGIKDSETVIALRGSVVDGLRPSAMNHWQNITRSSDFFGEFVQSLMSPSSRKESLRMRDLAIMKLDSSPRRRRQLFQRAEQNGKEEPFVCFGTSVISENADKLCTDPLPILW
jgi:hypothetical protein